MGLLFRNSLLGMCFCLAGIGVFAQTQPPAPPPTAGAKIPLSKIPRVHRAPARRFSGKPTARSGAPGKRFSPILAGRRNTRERTHSWTRQDSGVQQLCQEFVPNAQGVGSQQGNALWADASYTGRHWIFSTNYNDYSPGFCSELGFVNRVDIRQNTTALDYFWRPQASKVVDFGPLLAESVDWEHNATLQDWQAAIGFQVDLRKQTTATD